MNREADKSTIWTAWFQGRERAPRHVQRIFRLWEDLNPDRRLHVIEDAEAESILDRVGVRQHKVTPQIKSDIIRLVCLKEHGGVWVDSTVLPMAPLSDWVDELTSPAGFFAFHSSGDPNLVLPSWFLSSSEANNPLVSHWCDLFVDYFRTPRCWANWKRAVYNVKIRDYIRFSMALRRRDTTWFVDPAQGRDCFFYPYMTICYTFAYLLKADHEVREIWERVPVRWHTLPALAGRAAADPETPAATLQKEICEILPHAPVHKLNHKDRRFDAVVTSARELLGLPPDENP
ncbi:capsular polysaccharide synthesis protein [Aquisphaera insulae]|uniref:capsular polysaccharide synthesis protein n=1 Tax=Aquisphaera insulae TaxID=2712864 RepID=UPI0013ED57C9|nr:capsular polysaccharide synthesis protein [Aquisphaera insulae]